MNRKTTPQTQLKSYPTAGPSLRLCEGARRRKDVAGDPKTSWREPRPCLAQGWKRKSSEVSLEVQAGRESSLSDIKWFGPFLLTSCLSPTPPSPLAGTKRPWSHSASGWDHALAPCGGWGEQAFRRPTDQDQGGQPQGAPARAGHCGERTERTRLASWRTPM